MGSQEDGTTLCATRPLRQGARRMAGWSGVDPDEKEGGWKKVEQGNKIIEKVDPYYILTSN